jgi:tRNA A64-2'-O-ribosylphosphate transferase
MDFTLNYHNDNRSVLEHVRKESLDIYNRLHSIAEDAKFVQEVRDAYPELPVLRTSCLS